MDNFDRFIKNTSEWSVSISPTHQETVKPKKPLRRFLPNTILEVYSKVLCEPVIFASDDVEVKNELGYVIYRESELRAIVESKGANLKEIHEVKKVFGNGTTLLCSV